MLTLDWVGFSGVRFVVVVARGKITPTRLKLDRIMLDTWNVVGKNKNTFSFRKHIF